MKRLALLFFFLCNTVFAQQKKNYTIYINYPDYTLKANVLGDPIKMHANKNIDYYWYASNKILHTQGGFDGKVLDGEYTSFFLSNNLKERGNYKYGIRQGEWTTWFDNGNISSITEWKRGRKHGECTSYNEKGELVAKEEYHRGVLSGYSTTYQNNQIATRKKYRRGKEILPKVKKEVSTEKKKTGFFRKALKLKNRQVTTTSHEDQKLQERSTIKTETQNKKPKRQFAHIFKNKRNSEEHSSTGIKKKHNVPESH